MEEDRYVATREGTTRTELDKDRLRDRFIAEQGASPASAATLVDRIAAADDDIWNAAVLWARTGQMPAEPEIHGYTPGGLTSRLRPSQVFTALVGLRRDPRVALHALRYSPDDLPGAGREFEDRVAEVLNSTLATVHRTRGPGPDFVISTPQGTILVEAKATRDTRRLGPAIRSLAEAAREHGADRALLVVPFVAEGHVPPSYGPVQVIPLARLATEI